MQIRWKIEYGVAEGEEWMALKYNNAQHKQYLEMIDGVGRRWVEVFEGNTEFYSAAYWDLLTGIWRWPSLAIPSLLVPSCMC